MRKINVDLRTAWHKGKNCTISNSYILVDKEGNKTLVLFNNTIAKYEAKDKSTWFTMAGWDTATTRSRLREVLGVYINRNRKGELLYNGQIIQDTGWFKVVEYLPMEKVCLE